MSRFQDLKDFFERRLLAAVIRDEGEQRTTCGYEEELQRQRKLLDVILIPEIKLHRAEFMVKNSCSHTFVDPRIDRTPTQLNDTATVGRADVRLLMVKKEELPPEQQERSSYPDQEDKESPHIKEEQEDKESPLIKEEQEDKESPLIKEEQEELWISQEREQLQGLEEADTKFLFPSVHMKSESDEEKPQSSLLHQRLTDHMETAAGGEDCGRPEPAGSSDPERNLQPENEAQNEASDTGSGTEDRAEDRMETRDRLKRLKSATNKRVKTVKSNNCPEPGETNHVVARTKKRPFSCSECAKRFASKIDLSRHMCVHTKEKPHNCSECGKGFSQKGGLTAHMFSHSKEKPFSCSECGKGFSYKTSLMTHMLVHTNEKPFSCSECGKGFRQKQNLASHMSVHTKEKPFLCSECGKNFRTKQHLTAHMSVHTNEKPFCCSVCGKGFRQKGTLTEHMFVHSREKPFHCSECGKGFSKKGRLTKHMSVHSKVRMGIKKEAVTKSVFPSVHVKSENEEEKPQSSMLHQRLTDHMETAVNVAIPITILLINPIPYQFYNPFS